MWSWKYFVIKCQIVQALKKKIIFQNQRDIQPLVVKNIFNSSSYLTFGNEIIFSLPRCNPTFFWVNFFYSATKTNPMQFIQRIFVGKKCTKVTKFQGNVFWNCHIKITCSNMLPKYSKISKKIYFPLWPLAKLSEFFLWMITNVATSWKQKQNQKLCDI
jgi:hypothetical protein